MRAWTLCLLLALTGCGTMGERRDLRQTGLDMEEQAFAEALAHYGQGLLDEGEGGPAAGKAIDEFAVAAELDPLTPRIHSRLAIKALMRGETGKAIAELERSCRANPESLRAWLDLARTCKIAKRLDESIRHYRRALDLSPGNEQILAAIVAILFDQEEDEEALKIIKRRISRDGKDSAFVGLCHNRGREFIITGQSERAIACFELLSEYLPEDTHQYDYLLGEIYRTEKDRKKALRWYRRATSHKNPLPESFIKLALLQVEHDLDRATEDLERGIQCLPDSPLVLLTLASLYVQSGREIDAIPLYQRISELSSDSEAGELKANFYLNYGAACERAGQKGKAAEIFLEGVEKYPNTPHILNYLAYMWAEEGKNLDEALAHALKALETEPDNGAYLDTLGWIYYKQGDYQQAREKIESARELMPNDPTIIEHLGDVYLAMDNKQEAIVHWKESFLRDPSNESLATKLKGLNVDLRELRKQAEKMAR